MLMSFSLLGHRRGDFRSGGRRLIRASRDVELRLSVTLEIAVHPLHQIFTEYGWVARIGHFQETVAGTLYANQRRRHFEVLQDPEHFLAPRRRWRSEIVACGDEERRGLDVSPVGDRGLAHLLRSGPRRKIAHGPREVGLIREKPILAEIRDIACRD